MKKILALLLVLLAVTIVPGVVFSQVKDVKEAATVEGQVTGSRNLSISGKASIYASISMSIGGSFSRSATADQNGNFSISGVGISSDAITFCLTVTDKAGIGRATTCYNVAPGSSDITMNNLFLAPSLGLGSSSIIQGSSGLAYGYSMPASQVTLYIINNNNLVTTADSTGYFQFTINNLGIGTYIMYATAIYSGQQSPIPQSTIQLTITTVIQQITQDIGETINELLGTPTPTLQAQQTIAQPGDATPTQVPAQPGAITPSGQVTKGPIRQLGEQGRQAAEGLGPLWLLIPILISIIILVGKIWPDTATYMTAPFYRILRWLLGKKKKNVDQELAARHEAQDVSSASADINTKEHQPQ